MEELRGADGAAYRVAPTRCGGWYELLRDGQPVPHIKGTRDEVSAALRERLGEEER
jgi:hypothetical protein